MLKSLLITSILATIPLIADTSLGTQIGGGDKSYKIQKPKKSKKIKKFKKDHHRYDKRYRDFDYDNRGYYNDDGFYFGYFDRSGYFFNNIYFEYDSEYTYHDRVYIRGNFSPHHTHHRAYRYHRHNDWNREHCYREPDEIVYGHYYEERYYPQNRGHYRDDYRRDYYNDYQRDSYRRDSYRRDSYRRNYRRDDARVRDYRFSDRSSSRHRASSRRKDNARVRSHRFSDKKKSKSSGRLQITK
ncbi:hypothetical protein MNB_SV-12-1746 [hydrothermal vent metagenome]|uniref:Uncharacterized protein n=1 Tax=hydrothermal vent metagenome TaxID=652676 RepID=A0A1W1BT65_9ZZZZ